LNGTGCGRIPYYETLTEQIYFESTLEFVPL